MIQRSTKRMSLRALVVDDELGAASAEGRAARALVQELQGPRDRGRRGDFRRRRQVRHHLGFGDPRRARRLDAGRRQEPRQGARLPASSCARATTRSPSFSWPSAARPPRSRSKSWRWSMSSSGRSRTRRRSSAGACAAAVAATRGDAAAARRSADALQRRSTSTPGIRRATPAARRSSNRRSAASSSTTSARTCCARTCRSASAASARCSITPARSASTRSTPHACSARIARIA